MKSLDRWLSEYGESHQNKTNKAVHFICVPLIFFSLVGMFYGVKLFSVAGLPVTLAHVLLVLAAAYYISLSIPIAVGMISFSTFCLLLCKIIEQSAGHLLWIAIVLFILAWVAQFFGHHVEGKKPSFLKDIQFLLIGPAWIIHYAYKKIGL